MFNRLLRRLQKYTFPLKILVLIFSFILISFTIYSIPPTVPTIAFIAVLLDLAILLILSFFQPLKIAFLAATTLAFLLFLKAVSLATPLNLVLLAVFVILLGLYLRKK